MTSTDILRDPITLPNNQRIPRVGLGTWKTENSADGVQAVLWALEAGYRLIDTAKIYGNEEAVGVGMAQSAVPRADIFLTTKVWNADQGYETTLAAIDESLERLQTDYVDLYLVHWPSLDMHDLYAAKHKRVETWKAMEEILQSGKARSIGVSNYEIVHLEEMTSYATVPPVVNQIELHPFWTRRPLTEYCRAHQIAIEAYSPLVRGEKLQHATITEIARKHRVSHAQVLLRWGLQHGYIVIPKSTHQQRIRENIDLFDFALTDADMQMLDGLNANESVLFGTIHQ